MKLANLLLMFALLLGPTSGCSTKGTSNEDSTGLVTVSALIVALPLIPFALPYSIGHEISEHHSDKVLYQHLDPVYKERIKMIQARSPKADAEQAWGDKTAVFLPTTHGGDNYLGLEGTKYSSRNGGENQMLINDSPFLVYLQTHLSDDPLQTQVHNWNKIYTDFLDARWAYERTFNSEILRLIQGTNNLSALKK